MVSFHKQYVWTVAKLNLNPKIVNIFLIYLCVLHNYNRYTFVYEMRDTKKKDFIKYT